LMDIASAAMERGSGRPAAPRQSRGAAGTVGLRPLNLPGRAGEVKPPERAGYAAL